MIMLDCFVMQAKIRGKFNIQFFSRNSPFQTFSNSVTALLNLDEKDTGLAVGIIGTMKTLCVELLFINLCVVNALISKEDES